MALPPYGFVKEKTGKGVTNYTVHPQMGEVVKRIFDMYLDGKGYKLIAMTLTNEGVMPPQLAIDRVHGIFSIDKKYSDKWYGDSVRKMLKNEAYYGTLVNRKSVRNVINKRNAMTVPAEDRIYHDDFYPPIITKETFDRVQRETVNRTKNNYSIGSSGTQHSFSGMLKCAECGCNLVYKSNAYVCSTYHKFGKEQCTTHKIREDQLIDFVTDKLKILFENTLINYEKIDAEAKKVQNSFLSYNGTIISLKEKLLKLESKMEMTLNEKFEGRISEDMANRLIEKTQREYASVKEQIKEIEILKNDIGIDNKDLIKSSDILKMTLENKELTRSILGLIIDRIEVSQDKVEQQVGKRYPVNVKVVWRTPFLCNEEICPK